MAEELMLLSGVPFDACLCGACVHILSENHYKVVEHGRRTKITCSLCGKKRFGTTCTISLGTFPVEITYDEP